MIRVLTISKPYVAAAYRHKLALLQQSGRFEVGLICPDAWGQQRFEGKETRFWTRQLPIVWNGRNHFHLYRGLGEAVAAFRPDVLNVEEEHYSAVTWQAYRLARRHGAATLFYTWQNIAKRYPPPFSWIEQSVFRQTSVAVAGNAEAADVLRAKRYSGELVQIPQMGVELARFAPQDPAPSARRVEARALGLEDGFWLAFAGRVVEEKGIQDIVRALALLGDRPDVRLLVLGDGPYAPALRGLADEAGVAARVRFIPAVASTEVPRYLRAVDALCLPSLTRANWKEQFGRVLIESMAAAAALLGSSSGEIPLVIGDAGLVHREGDPAAAAAAIRRYLDEPGLWEACRTRGRERVRSRYTNEHVAAAFGAAFERAAAINRR